MDHQNETTTEVSYLEMAFCILFFSVFFLIFIRHMQRS